MIFSLQGRIHAYQGETCQYVSQIHTFANGVGQFWNIDTRKIT